MRSGPRVSVTRCADQYSRSGWRWAFLSCSMCPVIAFAVGAAGSHDSRAPVVRRLDWPGQVLAR